MPKLKDHILPRIKDMIQKEAAADVSCPLPQAGLLSAPERSADSQDRDSILFKNDRLYRHHLARFNYTTYDVRRAQDVINPTTSHRDVMLLVNNGNSGNTNTHSDHPFLYARVLGIYHTNVIYIGEGTVDYIARRVDFLWVRWFEYGGRGLEWSDRKLDSIRFPPMATEGSFGFVDPRDVLRGCHIIPSFAGGKAHLDEVGLSHCAQDARDWARYYVGRCVTTFKSIFTLHRLTEIRFVDRDMIMRYHWGLGIGHLYSHGQSAGVATASNQTNNTATDSYSYEPVTEANLDLQVPNYENDYESDVDDPELGFENRDDDLGEEEGSEDEPGVEYDDELLVALDDMYGFDASDDVDYHD